MHVTTEFEYCRVDAWPGLAWLAVCRPRSQAVRVFVGGGVETFPEWFAEAAWAGEFSNGDFDQVETVAGSGGRIRDGQITFVSATSTVDRLHSLVLPEYALVSNSLPCLLQAAGSSLRPSFPYYNRHIHSITQGLRNYIRRMESSAGDVQFTYFDNLTWDGRELRAVSKPSQAPEFDSFCSYRDYLQGQLREVLANANDSRREQSGFRPLATLSTGYDSPTVAVLAAACGCDEALTFDVANNGLPDSGATIAQTLGLGVQSAPRTAWRNESLPEIPVFASGQAGAVIFAGAEEHLANRLLLTGFSGDTVWDLHNHDAGPDILRGDTSGLGLTEYRLWVGFLHCPVPFWGARQARQIHAISKSAEMQPYVLPGTDYNRPICRRIVEEAGVARELFGREKKAAEPYLWLDRAFLTEASYADYLGWLCEQRHDWLRHRRLPPLRSVIGDVWLNGLSSATAAAARRCGKILSRVCGAVPGLQSFKFKRLSTIHPPLLNLRRYWFPWAVDRAKRRYAAITPEDVAATSSSRSPGYAESATASGTGRPSEVRNLAT